MNGPGKYDEHATALREATEAEGVIVIVLNGERGSGFSVQAPLNLTLSLPGLLREVADKIERGLSQ